MKRIIISTLAVILAAAHPAHRATGPHHPSAPPMPTPDLRPANEAFVRGDYSQAIAIYSATLASPNLSLGQRESIFVGRGYANLRLGHLTEATTDLRQAIALDPADDEASKGLYALQNRSGAPLLPSTAATSNAGWGPIARLAGRSWILATSKPVQSLRFEWKRVGISMLFAGKDAAGNRIEGQYFVDPSTGTMRGSYFYRGKLTTSDLYIAPSQYIVTGVPSKSGQRQIAQIQGDSSFNIVTQRARGKEWETVSTSVLVPASDEMIASLGWPDQPAHQESLLHGILRSMKEGAIAGFKEGTQTGISEAVQYRVHQITGTPACRSVSGEIIKCP
jgi:hypothetical protein